MKLRPEQIRTIIVALVIFLPFGSLAGIFILPYGGRTISNCTPDFETTYCSNLTADAPLSKLASQAGVPIEWPTLLVVPLAFVTFVTFVAPWAVAVYGRVNRVAGVPIPVGLVATLAPWAGLAPEWGYGVIISLFWLAYGASLYVASGREKAWEQEASAGRRKQEAAARAERGAWAPPPRSSPRTPRQSAPPPRFSASSGEQKKSANSPSALDRRTGYLEFMGIPVSATREEIRERYRDLAKIYHPDHWRAKPKASREMMRRLNEARGFLEG